jgi:hypothetical protein
MKGVQAVRERSFLSTERWVLKRVRLEKLLDLPDLEDWRRGLLSG